MLQATLFVVATVCSSVSSPFLMSTEELALRKEALVVDVRSHDDYVAGHIAGACHLDSASLSETRNGVKGMLRPVEQVTAILSAAGLDPKKEIVVYSGMKTPADLSSAARVFWVLDALGYPKIAILDGGLVKWQKEQRPVETIETKPTPIESLELTLNEKKLATKDQVMRALGDGETVLLDNRSREQYQGDKKEDAIARAGHIPSAASLPVSELLTPNNTLKSLEDLGDQMAGKGATAEAPIVTYCNTGRSASVGYFVSRMLGFKDVSLYDGSMAEWSLDDKAPVVCEAPEEK